MEKRKNGFTSVELSVVFVFMLIVILSLGSVFIIPWALDRYVGDYKIVNDNVKIDMIDNTVDVNKEQKFKVEIIPPSIFTKEVTARIKNPPEGSFISKNYIEDKFWFKWTPQKIGSFDIEIIFSDNKNIEKSQIHINVIDN